MNDDSHSPGPPRGGAGGPTGEGPEGAEQVGSVGEEAARLFGVLSDWAREQGTDQAAAAGRSASAFSRGLREVNEHVATGSQECRYCPVCQVIHVARQTSPEVRAHLAVAASSLMQAAAGLLATEPDAPERPDGVQRIDLDDDADWDEDR